jgi:hypothetical protein
MKTQTYEEILKEYNETRIKLGYTDIKFLNHRERLEWIPIEHKKILEQYLEKLDKIAHDFFIFDKVIKF